MPEGAAGAGARAGWALPGPRPWLLFWLTAAVPLALTWNGHLYDVEMYHAWGQVLLGGAVPYRDFAVEYPPVALLTVVWPIVLLPSLRGFAALFMVGMGLVTAAQKALLWRRAQRPVAFLLLLAAGEALLYTTYLRRFDVVAAACSSWALLWLSRRPRALWGWAILGLAAAVKLYPLFLLPPCLLWAARAAPAPAQAAARRWPVAVLVRGAVCTLTVFGTSLLLARLLFGARALDFFAYHRARGLHLPTSYTALWLCCGHLGQALPAELRYGALQVLAPWADAWAKRATLGLLLGLACTYAWLPRSLPAAAPAAAGPPDARPLWRGALAVLMATLLFAKVFSPQYAAWVLPAWAMASLGTAPRVTGKPLDRPQVDWVLIILGLLLCVSTAELFPGEHLLASAYSYKRFWLLLRSAVVLGTWLWTAMPYPWVWACQNRLRLARVQLRLLPTAAVPAQRSHQCARNG